MPRSTRSSANTSLLEDYGRGLQRITEYEAAAAYGEPALSEASSDEQIARAISESKRTALSDAQRRSPLGPRSYASSRTSTLLGSESSSIRSGSVRSTASSHSPTPTPRYAADEVIARNLARSWQVASVQSDLIADPNYTRPAGPPLVVRAPSPSALSVASSSSSTSGPRTSYYPPGRFSPSPSHASSSSSSSGSRSSYYPPSRALSPLLLQTRPLSSNGTSFIRTPSVRSAASVSSVRSGSSVSSVRSGSSVSSARSASSVSSVRSNSSISSVLSNVTRASRHSSLSSAARALRESLPPSLPRSESSSSTPRATPPQDSTTSKASKTSASIQDERALATIRKLATSPTRCARPGCNRYISAVAFDTIHFAPTSTADAPPPPALLAALHACCASCAQNHCRGCGAPAGCPPGCVSENFTFHVPPDNPYASSGSSASSSHNHPGSPARSVRSAQHLNTHASCPIPTHCPAARALGALAALIAFDRAHAAIGARAHDRAADKALLGPLHALVFFLSPSPVPFSPASPPASGLLILDDAPPPDPGDAAAPHPALPALVARSWVPAYAATLSARASTSAYGWRARRRTARCCGVLARPVRTVGAGVDVWLRGGGGASGGQNGGAGEPTTLRVLIRTLEGPRAALLQLAGATTFGPTVEKAHALCDGVLYLMLQDVLGEEADG
ncbi:hypothetical protein B0H10DRAFT_2218483 [Mycena sp. CBHHK59/15]|nr:hypothetical protein B0H10DRAFT_2218483 [Mycena sp. CBHHK59/15]